jgi:hypothetical protein
MKLSLGLTPRDYSVAGGAAYDSDAQAFIIVAGLTDNTQKSAVNTLVLNLKGYGIWTKMKAVYPIVGGTASTHKFNLINPLDTNAAFRLSFSTGWTHSSTGMTPSNAYANTFLSHNAVLTQNSWAASIYSRTNRAGSGGVSFGVVQAAGYSLIYPRSTANQFYAIVNALTDAGVNVTDSIGFMQIKRDSSTSIKLVKNTNINSFTSNSTSNNTIPFYLGARNQDSTASSYDNCELSFASIGDGLTDTEASNLYTAVQTFQTTLGRQV